MSGYSGAPPFGGQYNHAPYGIPFPQNPSMFNSMIPPPPPPQYAQQQPPYSNSYPQNGTSVSFGNAAAYHNNAQYQTQSFGQMSHPAMHPPIPPPPPQFYNAYGAYGSNTPYTNTYAQNGLPNTTDPSQNQFSPQQQQTTRSQGTHFVSTPATSAIDAKQAESSAKGNLQIPGGVGAMQELTKLQTISQSGDGELYPQIQGNKQDDVDEEVVALSSQDSADEQTTMQLESATTDASHGNRHVAVDIIRGSSHSSAESFNPYDGPRYTTLDGVNEIEAGPVVSVEQIKRSSLPGLGMKAIDPPSQLSVQADMEMLRQGKKTLALQAIQDLASRHIGFDLLSQEEIDVELLRDLYLESGVPMVLPTVAPEEISKTSDKPASTSLQKVQAPSFQTKRINVDPPTITAVPNFNLPLSTVVQATKPTPIPTTNDEVPSKAGPTVMVSAEAPLSATVPNRQDYLAKLQAAKEAVKTKNAQPSTVPPVQDRSSYLAKLQAAKEAVKQAPAPKAAAVDQLTISQQHSNTAGTRPDSTPTRANIDALLRQKLEALRKNQNTTTASNPQESNQSKVGAPPTNAEQRPASSGQMSSVAKLRTPVRTFSMDQTKGEEVSFFAPSIQKNLGGIPGLPGLSSMPGTPTTQQNQVQDSIVGISNSAGQAGLAGIPTPLVAHTSNVFAPEIHGTEPQETSESRTSRKRAVATDFIDSPPAKLHRVSSGPISLVIDVSDDEDDRMESVDDLVNNATVNERRGNQNLPALQDFPSRSNSYNTPPQVMTPDLQAKEDEIRELKQRIIAATLRRTGKATPNTPTASKPDTQPSSDAEQAKSLEDRQEAIRNGTKELTAQEKALAAAKLQAQRHLEHIRRSQASLNAHADKAQRDVDTAGNSFERARKVQRKAEIEAALSTIEVTIQSTEADLEVMKREQEQLLTRIRQQTQTRSSLMDELTDLLQTLEAEAAVEARSTLPSNPDTIVPSTLELRSASPAKGDSIGQNQVVPSGIDSVQSVNQAIQISSSSSGTSSRSGSPIQEQSQPVAVSDSEPETDEAEPMQIDDESVDEDEDEDYDPESINVFAPHSGLPDDETDEEENENPMDDYEPMQEVQALPGVSQIDSQSQAGLPTSYQKNIIPTEKGSEAVSVYSTSDNGRPEDVTELEIDSDSSDVQNVNQDQREVIDAVSDTESHDSSASRDSLYSDRHVDSATERQNSLHDNSAHANSSVPKAIAEEISDDEGVKQSSISSHQHFVPYESPLNQFTSYRFHPQFAQNVQGGFRSLTYNHKINPKVEICRWELAGGICNDPDCNLQHFKDMALTDNNLLLQLGSIHEGATQQEKEAYVAGLRDTINGMRARGLKDVDSIATEIVAYRQKFLGDSSRVITNLNLS